MSTSNEKHTPKASLPRLLMELQTENNALKEENLKLKEDDEKREIALKAMMTRTGLYPKIIDWTNKIDELELIIHGLEEGSAEWQLKASDLTRDCAAKDRELSELRTICQNKNKEYDEDTDKLNELYERANSELIRERSKVDTLREALEVIPGYKLRALAMWLDNMHNDEGDVQGDLRKMAELSDAALSTVSEDKPNQI